MTSRLPRSMALAILIVGFSAGFAQAQVSGVVTELGTGSPLEGALVTVQTTTIQTETAVDGTFTLPAASGSGLVIVAAKKGYFYASVILDTPATGVEFELEEVVIQFDTAFEFDPALCSFCHFDQLEQWEASRMGNTGMNLWVYDLVNGQGTPGGMNGFVYVNDGVNVATDPDGNCAACHQPARWIKDGGNVPMSLDFETPGVPLSETVLTDFQAMQGVSCDVCHRVADVDTSNLNTFGIDPSAFTMHLPGPQPLPPNVQFGVLGDVAFTDFLMQASYQPQLTHDMCAGCHQYFNDIDQDGVNDNVPCQTTWDEWANSPYGDDQSPLYQTCVDCHAYGFGADAACGPLAGLGRDPDTVHDMFFNGTDGDHVENVASIAMNVGMTGDQALVEVTVSNDFAGHDLPTGISVRHVVLLVDAIRVDDDLRLTELLGQEIHPLGGIGDPAQGYYGGLPGKIFGHFNMDAEGNEGVLFTEAVSAVSTAIPPLGSDTTSYAFALPVSSGGIVQIRARLIFRRAWRPLVDTKGWTTEGTPISVIGTPFYRPLEDLEAPDFGHLMAEAIADPIDLGPYVPPTFIRGDADGDGIFNGLIDALVILDHQFSGGPPPPCLESADVDDDGIFNGLLDGLYVLTHQFSGGPAPAAPYPGCGADPNPGTSLGCGDHPGCP